MKEVFFASLILSFMWSGLFVLIYYLGYKFQKQIIGKHPYGFTVILYTFLVVVLALVIPSVLLLSILYNIMNNR